MRDNKKSTALLYHRENGTTANAHVTHAEEKNQWKFAFSSTTNIIKKIPGNLSNVFFETIEINK